MIVTAPKTSLNNLTYLGNAVGVNDPLITISKTVITKHHGGYMKSQVKLFRKLGLLDDFEVGKHPIGRLYDVGVQRAKEYNQKRKSEILSRVRIEIIDV